MIVRQDKGQSAFEYLLLIAGAVLITMVALLLIIPFTGTGGNVININLGGYQNVGLDSGGTNTCGNNQLDASEACDASAPSTYPDPYSSGLCMDYNPTFSGGSLNCNSCVVDFLGCTDPTPPQIVAFSAIPGDFQISFSINVQDNTGFSSVELLKADHSILFATYNRDPAAFANTVDGVIGTSLVSGSIPNPFAITYLDEGVSNDFPYYYTLRACDLSGNCVYRDVSNVTPTGPMITVSLIPNDPAVEELVFDFEPSGPSDSCNSLGVTDTADNLARMFRTSDGTIYLASNHYPYDYLSIVGDPHNVNTFQRQCAQPGFLGYTLNPSQWDQYNQRNWIWSTYTENGTDIYGLLHTEYHDPSNVAAAPGCYSGALNLCVYYSITAAKATYVPGQPLQFNNNLYSPTAHGHVVATIPRAWPAPVTTYENGGPPRFGQATPSNIVKIGSYYYATHDSIVKSNTNRDHGACIMRTNNLSDPDSWRYLKWVDTSFSKEGPINDPDIFKDYSGLLIGPRSSWNLDLLFTQPKTIVTNPADPNNTNVDLRCGIIDWRNRVGGQSSITYNTVINKYFQVFALVNGLTGVSDYCQFWYSVSPDLLNWSKPQILPNGNPSGSPNCGWGEVYPSIIDADDTSLNFSNSGANPYIYFTQGVGPTAYYSDLKRRRLNISCPNC